MMVSCSFELNHDRDGDIEGRKMIWEMREQDCQCLSRPVGKVEVVLGVMLRRTEGMTWGSAESLNAPEVPNYKEPNSRQVTGLSKTFQDPYGA